HFTAAVLLLDALRLLLLIEGCHLLHTAGYCSRHLLIAQLLLFITENFLLRIAVLRCQEFHFCPILISLHARFRKRKRTGSFIRAQDCLCLQAVRSRIDPQRSLSCSKARRSVSACAHSGNRSVFCIVCHFEL